MSIQEPCRPARKPDAPKPGRPTEEPPVTTHQHITSPTTTALYWAAGSVCTAAAAELAWTLDLPRLAAAALLAGLLVGLVALVRAGHDRHLSAAWRSLRPVEPPTPPMPSPPQAMVAPDLHLPEIRGLYGKLGLLDQPPVSQQAAVEVAEYAGLLEDLRDRDFEARLDLAAREPLAGWDAAIAELSDAWDAASGSLDVRHHHARRRLAAVTSS